MATLADAFRAYVKPSMDGAIIIRKRTVTRKSSKVLERNAAFATTMGGPGGGVVQCRGKPWKEYVSCLRSKASTLGPGTAKGAEYRKKFWRHK